MNAFAESKQQKKQQPAKTTTHLAATSAFQFDDQRPEAIAQRKLNGMADRYSAQQPQPVQQKKNNTGLPDNLKAGVENLSGYSMDDVKVHYNSDKPAQLEAHAYAQGTDIHLAPGQEKHLAHEAWHVVQQKQGRVKPTRQLKGKVNINDNEGLEREADVMGAKALGAVQRKETTVDKTTGKSLSGVVQRAGKKPALSSIIPLFLEGVGHIAMGILATVAGAGAISSLALAPVGILSIVGGVGQMVVGISKMIRGGVMAYARSKGSPLSNAQGRTIAVLTAIEGAIIVATSVAGAAAGGAILGIISKSIGAFSALLKFIRGGLSVSDRIRKKMPKWIAILEGVISGFGAIPGALASAGTVLMGAINFVVNLVKDGRGTAGTVNAFKDKKEEAAARRKPIDVEISSSDEEEFVLPAPIIVDQEVSVATESASITGGVPKVNYGSTI